MSRATFTTRHFWDAPKTGGLLMGSTTVVKQFVPGDAAFWIASTLFVVGCVLVGFKRKPAYEPLLTHSRQQ